MAAAAPAVPYQSFSERMFRGGLRGFLRETFRGANVFNIFGRIQEGLDAGVAGSYNTLGFFQRARRVLGTAVDLSATTALSTLALPLMAKALFVGAPVMTGFLDGAAKTIAPAGLQVVDQVEKIIQQSVNTGQQVIGEVAGAAGGGVGPFWANLKTSLDNFLSNLI